MTWRTAWKAIKEFAWGLFVLDLYKTTRSARDRSAQAWNLVVLGEFIGLPLMTSVVTLRVLPYLLPELGPWKERQVRDVEVMEAAPEIH